MVIFGPAGEWQISAPQVSDCPECRYGVRVVCPVEGLGRDVDGVAEHLDGDEHDGCGFCDWCGA